jgi:hypothetical protein
VGFDKGGKRKGFRKETRGDRTSDRRVGICHKLIDKTVRRLTCKKIKKNMCRVHSFIHLFIEVPSFGVNACRTSQLVQLPNTV